MSVPPLGVGTISERGTGVPTNTPTAVGSLAWGRPEGSSGNSARPSCTSRAARETYSSSFSSSLRCDTTSSTPTGARTRSLSRDRGEGDGRDDKETDVRQTGTVGSRPRRVPEIRPSPGRIAVDAKGPSLGRTKGRLKRKVLRRRSRRPSSPSRPAPRCMAVTGPMCVEWLVRAARPRFRECPPYGTCVVHEDRTGPRFFRGFPNDDRLPSDEGRRRSRSESRAGGRSVARHSCETRSDVALAGLDDPRKLLQDYARSRTDLLRRALALPDLVRDASTPGPTPYPRLPPGVPSSSPPRSPDIATVQE